MSVFEYDENLTLSELFKLPSNDYSELDISSLPLSTRVTNRLYRRSIKTVQDLLSVTPAFLMDISGFGRNCIDQVYSCFEKFDKENAFQNRKPIMSRFKDMIALGDFSFMKEGQLSDSELITLEKYKKAYEVLGEGLVLDCVFSPEHIIPVVRAIEDFIKRTERNQRLVNILRNIPVDRQQKCSKFFIEAYSYDDCVRRRLASFYASESARLSSIIYTIDTDKLSNVIVAERFLKWCDYDLKAQIADMFENIYVNERIKQIVEARSQKQTLSVVGKRLNITRERVRQIEAKAIRDFTHYQSRIKIMDKLYAEQNGQSIIALGSIEAVGGTNAAALIFLLRQTEGTFYTYDTTLDAFVIGENDMATRVQDYVDSLPDVIHKKEIHRILEAAKQEYDLDTDYLEKVISESYKLTGDVYHILMKYQNIRHIVEGKGLSAHSKLDAEIVELYDVNNEEFKKEINSILTCC